MIFLASVSGFFEPCQSAEMAGAERQPALRIDYHNSPFDDGVSGTMMSEYPYNFDVKVTETLVYLPKQIVSQLDLGKSKRLRIDGEINGIRIECGLTPDKGKWCFMVSKKLQKLCGIAPGDMASVSFDITDSEAVVVPQELQYALEANDAAMAVPDKSIPKGAKLA